MTQYDGWSVRVQAELDELEEFEEEWEELRRTDEQIAWLVDRIRAGQDLPPWRIVVALEAQSELGRAFLGTGSWESVSNWLDDEPSPEPGVAVGVRYWSDLTLAEEAIEWLDARLDQGGGEARALMGGLLDQLIDLWEERAVAASAIPKEQLDA